ncbi:MAG: transporter [Solirubrobacterales bacterium]|nr:transporter [Solirubrobacterales bacterium]
MIVVLAAMAAATGTGLLLHARSPEAAARIAGWCLRALLWVFVPFLVVVSLPRLHVDAGLAAGLGLGYVAATAAGLAAYAIGSRILHLSREGTGTLIVCALVMNATYMGFPFVGALLGTRHVPEAIAFDSLVNGPLFYVAGFAIGAAFGTRSDVRRRAVLLRNPPLFAAAIGLALPASAIPGVLVDLSHGVVWVLLALGFVALGVTLASEARPRLDAPVVTAVGLRILLAPALYLGLTALIGGVPPAFRIEEAMPVGINSLVVAHATGLDLRLASSAIAFSTVVVAAWGLIASIA